MSEKGLNIKKIIKDFPILSRTIRGKPLVYFDNAATTQKPRQVIEAISDFYKKHNANVHRGIHTLSEEASEMAEEARSKVSKFIGVRSKEEIIFVRNATEAINLVMYAWGGKNIKKGDVVVTSLIEHHSNLVTWQELAKRKGAKLKIIDVDNKGRLIVSRKKGSMRIEDGVEVGPLESLLDEQVKLVAITQVSNLLGTIVPLEDITRMVKKKAVKALILVDAVQSVPHMPVDVVKLKADFLVFSGHKMLGPTGTGVLWAKKEILEKMDPFMFGGDMISEVNLAESRWNKLPWKFEAGTPDISGIVGLGAAVDYLEKIGMNEVREHEKKLVEYGILKIEELERKGVVEFYGLRDSEERGGILTFNVRGVHAHDVAQILDNEGIAVRSGHHCAMPLTMHLKVSATVRASFYIYNREEEIDQLVKGIYKVRKVMRIEG